MKSIQQIFILLLMPFLLSALFSCKQQSNNPEAAAELPQSASVQELGQMNRDFAKALSAKDAVAAANLYDENASLLPTNEPIVNASLLLLPVLSRTFRDHIQ